MEAQQDCVQHSRYRVFQETGQPDELAGVLGLVKMGRSGGSVLPVQQGQVTAGKWVMRGTLYKWANHQALNYIQG